MQDAWEDFQSVASAAIDPLWYNFAEHGREGEVFSPMAKYPRASAWLADSMSLSDNYITRKLGAMLAGWIIDAPHAGLLAAMLDRERKTFADDSLTANSVGEDIMFAATRWAWSDNAQIKEAGIQTLARMIWDALDGTPWNTANWAVANLRRATGGNHPIFAELLTATDEQLKGQQSLQKVVNAWKLNDEQKLKKSVTPPSEAGDLSPADPSYSMVCSLWNAAAAAEKSL